LEIALSATLPRRPAISHETPLRVPLFRGKLQVPTREQYLGGAISTGGIGLNPVVVAHNRR
jgi:hypothetical protein